METHPSRALFIGLDSAEPNLIDELIERGQLPNLALLKRDARCARLRVPPGLSHQGTWASLYTGVNPGEHGVAYGTRMRTGTYDQRAYDLDTEMTSPPVWRVLGEAGHSCVVIDVPKAPFNPPPRGMQIADWRTHGFNPPTRSQPAMLAAQLRARFGPDPLGDNRNAGLSRVSDFAAFRDALLQRIADKTTLAVEHLAARPALTMVCYSEPHDIGHHAWHLHDPRCARYDAARAAELGDPVTAVYRALDDAVGRLVEAAGSDVRVLCFAGPGMQPLATGNHLLELVLRRLAGQRGSAVTRLFERIQGLARLVVPPGIRYRIAKRREVFGLVADRSSRPAFTVASNTDNGAIRVNLEGREPQGIVAPEAYDRYCDSLAAQLMALRDARTGAPAVEEVVPFRRRYHGKEVASVAPDLLVTWNRNTPLKALTSPAIGTVSRNLCDLRSGDHSTNTLFMAAGPGISPGAIDGEPPVESVAPTLTALFGVNMVEAEYPSLPL
jgi:predicted AlkP superfamily phosphohydrolase/phosphomutase